MYTRCLGGQWHSRFATMTEDGFEGPGRQLQWAVGLLQPQVEHSRASSSVPIPMSLWLSLASCDCSLSAHSLTQSVRRSVCRSLEEEAFRRRQSQSQVSLDHTLRSSLRRRRRLRCLLSAATPIMTIESSDLRLRLARRRRGVTSVSLWRCTHGACCMVLLIHSRF